MRFINNLTTQTIVQFMYLRNLLTLISQLLFGVNIMQTVFKQSNNILNKS